VTARILGIELRRSGAIWAAAITIPLAFAWPQVAEGMTGVMGEQRSNLANLVPLALGLGAWQARRDRRSRMPELLATAARPEWQRLLHTATALGLAVVTGSLVVFAGLAVYGAVLGAYIPAVAVASAVVTALWLATAVWLGLAVGRMVPWALIPPLLLVGGAAAMVWLSILTDTEGYPDGPPPGTLLLNPASSTGFDAFETLTGRAQLAQASWVLALAAASLLLGVARRRRPAAVLPALGLGLAVALSLLPSSLHDAITLDRGALALVCTPDDRPVCARRLHPRVLDDLRQPGRQALALLSAKLPQAPSRVVEAYRSFGNDAPVALEPRADTLYAEVSTDGTGRVDAAERDILWTLLMGAGTLPCPDAQRAAGPRYHAARLVAAAWLLEEEPPAPTDPDDPALASTSVTGPAYETLLSAPAGEQRARVAALREAELACAPGDRLDILVGSGES
jgi:hypothetical protein